MEVVPVPCMIDGQVPAVGAVLVHVSLALVGLVTAHGVCLRGEMDAGAMQDDADVPPRRLAAARRPAAAVQYVICIFIWSTTSVTPGAAHAACAASSIDCQDEACPVRVTLLPEASIWIELVSFVA